MFCVFAISMGVGRFYISPVDVVNALIFSSDATTVSIIYDIRLPRAILSSICGGILCLCGLILQGVFKNPLAGPHITGVSTASAFGGSFCILLGFAQSFMIAISFLFGIVALIMLFTVSKLISRSDIFLLILSGIIINGFFAALISLLQYLADNEEVLPNIVYWLMGSFINANYEKIWLALTVCACFSHYLSYEIWVKFVVIGR